MVLNKDVDFNAKYIFFYSGWCRSYRYLFNLIHNVLDNLEMKLFFLKYLKYIYAFKVILSRCCLWYI